MTPEDLDRRFSYHPPRSEQQIITHEKLRKACRAVAGLIEDECPDGREKSTAITKVEEALFWANAALARSPE